ncbi:MAG TPA: VanW family protein [Gaiellaceae bacterium]|nr:VanW family protein [Gaiellaceae bacterium]
MGRRLVVGIAALLAVVAVVLGFVFAGSAARLADGTQIAGVDVGGLTAKQATQKLDARYAAASATPGTFTAGGKTFRIPAKELSVQVDFKRAVADAMSQGGGSGVVRGYRRLALKFSPISIDPRVEVYDAAVTYEVSQIAQAVDRRERNAALVRRGLHITVSPGEPGVVVDQAAARTVVVNALASFARTPVALPVTRTSPSINVDRLLPAQRLASRIIAAPVTLRLGKTQWKVPRWRLATLLHLGLQLSIAGPAAEKYFAQLRKRVNEPARDATWAPVAGGNVRLVAAQPGTALDIERSAELVLAAAERTQNRVATLATQPSEPQRSTAQAKAMGITGTVGSYETLYSGVPNRLHNVQLVARLIDGKLIAPNETFSFNRATGERTAAKGFRVAPVIINGEVTTGLGGGVCQVSTTVFNAAFEAGLPITARTNHALYISHYPLGRDATVDYPDLDLKFVNDTGHWLLLRTFVGSDSLSVVLYGTPVHRRVEATAAPLVVTGKLPVKKTVDATLKPNEIKVDDPGVPPQKTSVERKVYSENGTLLSDQTWYSSYRAEPKLERVGPKPKRPKALPAAKQALGSA